MVNNKNIFENFKLLKNDMLENGWVIEGFSFKYKNIEFVTLVHIYQEDEVKPDYSLLRIEFIRIHDSKEFHTHVNVKKFFIDDRIKEFRDFFNINFSKNLGDILKQFNEYFSNFIPIKVNIDKSIEIKKYVVKSLSESDNKDPNKLYCHYIKRNEKDKKRTIYNSNKTRILRPKLYSKFNNDISISFCYSDDSNKDFSDEMIILNFFKKDSVF